MCPIPKLLVAKWSISGQWNTGRCWVGPPGDLKRRKLELALFISTYCLKCGCIGWSSSIHLVLWGSLENTPHVRDGGAEKRRNLRLTLWQGLNSFGLCTSELFTWEIEIYLLCFNLALFRFSAICTNSQFSSAQSLSRVWLFATPWTAACQASLSIVNSNFSLY